MDKRWKGGVEVEGCVDLKVSNGEGEGEDRERERQRDRDRDRDRDRARHGIEVYIGRGTQKHDVWNTTYS